MGREKKITVKPIANTALKPAYNSANQKLYPLYAQVTYDRKTTKFPIIPNSWIDESLEKIDDDFNSLWIDEVKIIADFELKRKGKFTVRGFAEVYKIYQSDLLLSVKFYLGSLVDDQVQDILTANEYKRRVMTGELCSAPVDIYACLKIIGSRTSEKVRETYLTYTHVKDMTQKWTVYDWLLSDAQETEVNAHGMGKQEARKFISEINLTVFRMIDERVFTVFI